MPEAVDVGSVLGGRYKVTAYVLASAEKDLVLDGVDQVLNRPVSILVASADNASQVATSARELATGDRNGNIQVLDLGITDGGTYLVTNRAPAADMLDLIVQQAAPPEPAPYIEPFFTDTLGSEIFGRPRSTEPETYEYEEYEDDDETRPRGKGFAGLAGLAGITHRFRRPGTSEDDVQDDDTSALPPVVADPAPSVGADSAAQASAHRVPPPPSRKPTGASSASAGGQGPERGYDDGSTTDEDRRRHDDSDRRRTAGTGPAASGLTSAGGTTGPGGIGAAGAAGLGAAGVAAAAAPAAPAAQSERPASRFPLSGRRDDDAFEDAGDPDSYDPDEDNETSGGRKFTRVLVGVVLTIVLVVAVFAAATTLSSISGGNPVADTVEPEQVASEPASEDPATAAPAPTTAPPTPDAVEPVITGITRLVPGNPGLDQSNDANLPLIIDGNPSTYWGNLVYASDTFGGLATSLALVVEFEEESAVSEVEISQLNGSGGSFTVLVNDEPVLEGAEQIAQGGFTGPTVSLPIPDNADGAPTGQYVIINFTQLPRLSNIQAQYPFGLRIAEITVS